MGLATCSEPYGHRSCSTRQHQPRFAACCQSSNYCRNFTCPSSSPASCPSSNNDGCPSSHRHHQRGVTSQIAELTRGQLSLQTQFSGLITTLNTINVSSLPANPPLLAIGGAAPVAKAGVPEASAKAAAPKAEAAPAVAKPIAPHMIPVTPNSAMTGSPALAPNEDHFPTPMK